jgi:hypothetical protein
MRVEVYRNLHKHCWSVRSVQTGKVVAHVDVATVKDARFVVRPAGRAKVLRDGRKNVHAFVKGEWVPDEPDKGYDGQASYNPKRFGYFRDTVTDSPVHQSPKVFLQITSPSVGIYLTNVYYQSAESEVN